MLDDGGGLSPSQLSLHLGVGIVTSQLLEKPRRLSPQQPALSWPSQFLEGLGTRWFPPLLAQLHLSKNKINPAEAAWGECLLLKSALPF